MNHKTYVTFGFDHSHTIKGKKLNHTCVAVLKSEGPDEGRALAFELFGPKFCMEYPEAEFDHEMLHQYFKAGLVEVN